MRFAVDESIRFEEEPDRPYTVQAIDSRFAVLTRPMTQEDADENEYEGEIDGNVMYTIVDNETWRRGPNNAVLNDYDYKLRSECERCVRDLSDPDNWLGLSERHGRSIPVCLADEAITVP